MSPALVLVCAVAAGLLAGLSPRVLAVLPEPQAGLDTEPTADLPPKIPYAELARTPGLAWKLAIPATVLAALAASTIAEPALVSVWLPIAAAAPLLAWIDWKVHLLPYLVVAPLYVLTWLLTILGAALLRDPSVLLSALIGNLAVFGFYYLLGLVGPMGYGDVRLSAVLGVALGPLGVVTTFYGVFLGMLIGAVAGLVLTRGRLGSKAPIAFGPYLLLGAFAALWI